MSARPTSPTPPPSRLQELFDAAVDLPTAERGAWLHSACGGDDALRREVESLIASERAAPGFLDRPAADVELEGRRAGPWRIVELLSSGGMGDVHRAERADAELPWSVALKVLKRGLDGEAFVRRFHEERRALAALAHPNIVALVDAGTLEDGRPFLAMELVQGRRIDRHSEEKRLPTAARVRLLLDVCSAVEHAHRRFVVHCDLKPANVLVTAEGTPKLLDFGVARLIAPAARVDEAARPPTSTLQPWTPGYASPELMDGRVVGCASDVWSLGVLLFEVCTGERAFARAGLARDEIEAAVRAGPIPRTSAPVGKPAGERALRGDLRAIVEKATAADPERRYGSVEALAADLRAWLQSRPVVARQGGVLYRTQKLVRRNRVATAMLAVAVGALGWAGVRAWQDLQRSKEEARLGWGAHAQALGVAGFLERIVVDASSEHRAELGAALDRARARLDAAGPIAAEAEGRARLALGALYLEVDRAADAQPQLARARDLAERERNRGFGRQDIERIRELLARADARLGGSR